MQVEHSCVMQSEQDGENLLLADGTSSSQEAADQGLAIHPEGSQAFDYLLTAKAIWQPALSVLLVYTITLAIFPGFLAEDVSSECLGSWYPVLLITAFNIADAAGKVLPVQPRVAMTNPQLILYLCVARSLFLPAFYAASQGAGPAVVSLLTFLLGLSNGYFTAVSMMLAPQQLQVGACTTLHAATPVNVLAIQIEAIFRVVKAMPQVNHQCTIIILTAFCRHSKLRWQAT